MTGAIYFMGLNLMYECMTPIGREILGWTNLHCLPMHFASIVVSASQVEVALTQAMSAEFFEHTLS